MRYKFKWSFFFAQRARLMHEKFAYVEWNLQPENFNQLNVHSGQHLSRINITFLFPSFQ